MHSVFRTDANRALATVKSILILLASLTTTILVFMFGVALASHIVADRAPHKFAHLDAPDLWTSTPVVIDPSKQHYERLAAVEQPVNVAASNDAAAPGLENVAAVDDGRNSDKNSNLPSAQAAGDMETPASPMHDTSPADSDSQYTDSQVSQAREAWCAARYSSYRPEDNTYQPYGGGGRRPCAAPQDVIGSTPVATTSGSSLRGNQDDGSMEWAADNSDQVTTSEMTLASTSTEAPDSQAALISASADQPAAEGGTMAVSDGGGDGSQSDSHQAWCMARYHSYRISDDSYQPFDGGPRRACQSPLG